MPTMTGAEAAIRTLKSEGISVFFGVPGGENLKIFDVLHEHPEVRPIVARHEQGVAFMADGYARASQHVGVAVTISGNGFMNAMTPLAQAKASASPVLHLTGSNPQGLVEHVSVWNQRIGRTQEVPGAIYEALHRMATVRPGPAVLGIAGVLEQEDEIEIPERTVPEGKEADPQKIAEAARLLVRAERPLIYVGQRVVRLRASEELVQLAERLGAPYFTTRPGKGAVRENTPLYLGAGWDAPIPGEVSDRLMGSVDVALCVEAEPTLGEAFSGNVIRVGIDAADGTAAQLALAGHPRTVLRQLHDEVEDLGGRRSTFPLKIIEAFRKEAYEHDRRIAPLALETLALLRQALPPEAIVMSDSLIGLWGCRWYEVLEPNTFHFPNGTLGFGMPSAIGAKLACPDRPVVAIAGDGAFMFTASDLATAVQNDVPIKIVLCNSGGFEAIRHHQMNRFGRAIGYDVRPPDFLRFADAFGAEAVRISSHEELPDALAKVLNTDKVSLIDMPLAIPPM